MAVVPLFALVPNESFDVSKISTSDQDYVGISNQADGAEAVYAIDLDRDGDYDVLSASFFDSTIAWYENLGNGMFGGRHIIDDQANLAQSVFSSDINSDGYPDVLSASYENHTIAWYENLTQ